MGPASHQSRHSHFDIHGTTNVAQWRDPFLFVEGGQTYMVLGGNLNNGRGGGGCVLLYRATTPDLTKWNYLGVIFRYRDLRIYNVECPNLFRLGDKWVLLMSPGQTDASHSSVSWI